MSKNRKPLIIGIDPGTTSAVAGIDFNGEIVFIESQKELKLEKIIEITLENGRPVIVASDKADDPSVVEKYASSLGLELYTPKKDLSKDRKSELGEGSNSHEVDAVAAAKNAFNNLQKQIRKIEDLAESEEITELKAAEQYLLEIPVSKSDNNNSVDDSPEVTDNTESIETRLKRKNQRLEQEVERLREEIEEMEKEKEGMREKISGFKDNIREEVVKEEEIRKREGIIKEKNKEISELESSLSNARKIIQGYEQGLKKLFKGDKLVPKASKVDSKYIQDEVIVSGDDDLESFEDLDLDLYHVEEIKGIELKKFFVVEKFTEKDFKDIIDNYRS